MLSSTLIFLYRQFYKLKIVHIIFLGLVLRVSWLWISKPIPVSDFAEYQRLAINLLRYHQFGYPTPTAYRLPGYPIFLAFFSLISNSDIWLSLINIFLSLLIVYFIYILAKRLASNEFIGICAAFIASIYPLTVFFSPILASEHLFTVLLYGGLILLLSTRAEKSLYLDRLFAGLLFGLATITRGEAFYYIPVIILISILPIENWNQQTGKSRIIKRMISLSILFASWIAVTLPWYIRNQIVLGPGSGLGTSGGIMFYYGYHDEAQAWQDLLSADNLGSNEIERSANAFKKGLDYVSHQPIGPQIIDKVIESLHLYAPNAYPVFWSLAIPAADGSVERPLPGLQIYNLLAISGYLIVGTLAFTSLFFIRQYPVRLWITTLGFAIMNWVGYAILFAATSRYRYSIEGFLCILASAAIWKYNVYFKQIWPAFKRRIYGDRDK
jgi:4-amino-4-deoxy-L-arabinose transferase-like glycosyltransferase